MAIAYRVVYPEASSNAIHYRNVVSDLQFRRSTLQGVISYVKARNPANYESPNLRGDYYNKYVAKKDDWFDQLDQIISRFERFLLQVDSCIQSADYLENMWNNRIGLTEAYDDGK